MSNKRINYLQNSKTKPKKSKTTYIMILFYIHCKDLNKNIVIDIFLFVLLFVVMDDIGLNLDQ